MKKIAVVTGVLGQDGAYLAEFLLNTQDYIVFGTYRRTSSLNTWRIERLGIKSHPNFNLIEFDITDLSSCIRLIESTQPDEIYNLAAQSFVGVSFSQPLGTAQVDAIGPLNLLEAIRILNPKIKMYQASTSEMFGKVQEIPQSETTPFYPRSPYGVSKLFAHWMCINYWESYGIFACSGILFNHESPLRSDEFVTRKITKNLAKIKKGIIQHFELGNIDAKRDWGHAKDYVKGMWMMMQQDTPQTFILSTGKTRSVREFLVCAAHYSGFDLIFEGSAQEERAIDKNTGKTIVKINSQLFRPAEVDILVGSSAKAKELLG